jgi:2',3'-cyclic-nucleotide 2'-phosphodiesterase (5'-nucleotidase family)
MLFLNLQILYLKAEQEKNIDMVLLNHGGIRSILPKGKVTTKTGIQTNAI